MTSHATAGPGSATRWGPLWGARPADWSDIAILLPTRTSLPQLEAALDDAGIPYRVDSASLVWGS